MTPSATPADQTAGRETTSPGTTAPSSTVPGTSVLVTGASGFLGRAVVRALLADGYVVRTLQRTPSRTEGATDVLGSVTDPEVVARAVAGVDAVVHLAAKVSLAGDPADFERVNVGGTQTLLDAAQAAGVRRVVHVSSPSVAHHGDSIVGDDAGPADPALARGDYARTKAAAELLALARDGATLGHGSPTRETSDADRAREGDVVPDRSADRSALDRAPTGDAGSVMHVVAVRPHLVWGPGDTQLVARVVERARAGRLPLLGHGAALIDSTYVDNAASAIAAALRAVDEVHGQAYVVTNGEPRPVAELLAGICRAAGVEPPRWSVPAAVARAAGSAVETGWKLRPGADEPPMTRFLAEQLSTAHWFDQRRTRRDLRWEPAVSVDEGLRRLAESYR